MQIWKAHLIVEIVKESMVAGFLNVQNSRAGPCDDWTTANVWCRVSPYGKQGRRRERRARNMREANRRNDEREENSLTQRKENRDVEEQEDTKIVRESQRET